jgi:hypothetical protein
MIRETFVMRGGKIVPKRLAAPLVHAAGAPMVMSDLPEYRTVVTDKATGKRVHIGGRRQHREFLQRNGYTEVGNEYVTPKREELSRAERITDIRRIIGDL